MIRRGEDSRNCEVYRRNFRSAQNQKQVNSDSDINTAENQQLVNSGSEVDAQAN